MLIATWNLNSLRARRELFLSWLDEHRPDVVALQETRLPESEFPHHELGERGYHAAHNGTGGRAGVAIAARAPLADVSLDFHPSHDSATARIVRATVDGTRVLSVYVPTRRAIGKVDWLDRLRSDLLSHEDLDQPLLLCGDFNICFDERDVYNVSMLSQPERFPDRTEDRAFRRLLDDCQLQDLFRAQNPDGGHYSWFDYRRRAFERRRGMRLDYIFATPAAAARCRDVWIDYDARGAHAPSDHAPVCTRLI